MALYRTGAPEGFSVVKEVKSKKGKSIDLKSRLKSLGLDLSDIEEEDIKEFCKKLKKKGD